jgi:hypothetical protein
MQSQYEVSVDAYRATAQGPAALAAYAESLGIDPSDLVALWSEVLQTGNTSGYTIARIQLPSGADASWMFRLTPCLWAPDGVPVAAGAIAWIRNRSTNSLEPIAEFVAEDYVPAEGSPPLGPVDPAVVSSRRWRLNQLDYYIDLS